MIVMTFTIERDIGLSFLLQAALSLASDRSRDENSSSWAVQAIVRPLPTRAAADRGRLCQEDVTADAVADVAASASAARRAAVAGGSGGSP